MKAATAVAMILWLWSAVRLWRLKKSFETSGTACSPSGAARHARGAAFWLRGLSLSILALAPVALVVWLPSWQRRLMTDEGTLAFVSPLSVPALLVPGFLAVIAAACLLSLRFGFEDRLPVSEKRRLASGSTVLWLLAGLGILLGMDDYIEVRPEGVAVNSLFGLTETLHPWHEIAAIRFYPGEYVWTHKYDPSEPELSPRFDMETRGGEIIPLWNYPIWPSPDPEKLARVAEASAAHGIPVAVDAPAGLTGREAGAFYAVAARLRGLQRRR